MTESHGFRQKLKQKLHTLYYSDEKLAFRFRMALLCFDIVVIFFFIISSMFEANNVIYIIDFCLAGVILIELLARASLQPSFRKLILDADTWVDLVVIFSLLASMFVDNLSFLRVIRMLRLLRSYHVMRDLARYWPWFHGHYDIIKSTFNLFVFIFFITACVYVVESHVNDQINNYFDALYFTVATLTTTGFGDIIMTDTPGRLLAILIMVVGVSLFLHLVQTIFRPRKILQACEDCGLQRHDMDAVHCKHCGKVIHIQADGY